MTAPILTIRSDRFTLVDDTCYVADASDLSDFGSYRLSAGFAIELPRGGRIVFGPGRPIHCAREGELLWNEFVSVSGPASSVRIYND